MAGDDAVDYAVASTDFRRYLPLKFVTFVWFVAVLAITVYATAATWLEWWPYTVLDIEDLDDVKPVIYSFIAGVIGATMFALRGFYWAVGRRIALTRNTNTTPTGPGGTSPGRWLAASSLRSPSRSSRRELRRWARRKLMTRLPPPTSGLGSSPDSLRPTFSTGWAMRVRRGSERKIRLRTSRRTRTALEGSLRDRHATIALARRRSSPHQRSGKA